MGELRDWYKNAASRARVITKCYPGQMIHMIAAQYKDKITGDIKYVRKQYIVDEVYPGFVRCHAALHGETRHTTETTFNLGDLVINGYEPGVLYDCDYIKIMKNSNRISN